MKDLERRAVSVSSTDADSIVRMLTFLAKCEAAPLAMRDLAEKVRNRIIDIRDLASEEIGDPSRRERL